MPEPQQIKGKCDMRVVLSTWGSRGDVEPLAALAARLRELGAEATVCAPPDDEYAALLARAGVPHLPLGPSVRSVVTGERRPDAAQILAPKLVAARYETLTAAAEGCDALLATGLMPAGASSVAEKLGIRYVLACFHPFGLPSHQFLPAMWQGPRDIPDYKVAWDQDAERVNGLYLEAENSHRVAIGLPPVDSVREYVLTGQPWLAVDPILGPWQDVTDLDLVQTGAWILPDDRPLADELVAFLDAGDPPVYVGFGSMTMRTSPDLATVVVKAVRTHGRRVVLARGLADLALTDDQDDCFVVGEVNQQALFPRVAAVVHHGGAGTTTTAALAGAPQVIVPQLVDQPHWAARVAELGIGAAHDGPTPTADSLSAALAIALTTETRARAIAVGGTMSTDGTTVAAEMLLSP
jgi:vancomycin aglycone glucosyltransferase